MLLLMMILLDETNDDDDDRMSLMNCLLEHRCLDELIVNEEHELDYHTLKRKILEFL